MNTVNTSACPRGVSFRLSSPPCGVFGDAWAGDFVFSGVPEYSPPAGPNAAVSAENTPNRPRNT